MKMNEHIQRLSSPLTLPLRRAGCVLQQYDRRTLRSDLLAGLTVSVVAVPQSMAYAVVAGVPVEYGIYTLIFQVLIGSVFSSHPLLSVGPINTQSLLVASIVTRLTPGSSEAYLLLVVALTFMKGLMQLAMAALRLGHLVRYVSHSVIVGFTAGAGVLIMTSQVHHFLGFAVERSASDWPGIIGAAQRLAPNLSQIHMGTIVTGCVAIAVVMGCRYRSRLLPGALFAVVGGSVVVAMAGWTPEQVPRIGELPRGLPWPSWPVIDVTLIEPLATGAMALALLGLIEAYAISKSLSQKTGVKISANQELFGQGLTNLLSSGIGCVPGSGSFARSALNQQAGAKTFMAGIFNGLFVLTIYLLFAPAANFVPMSAIAAVLFVIAIGLIDWRHAKRLLHSNRADAAVCLGTFAATLLMPLSYAVFIGVFLNLALYLRRTSQLHINEMVRTTSSGPFLERPLRDRTGDQQVIFLQMEGDLFFGIADELADRFTRLSTSGMRVVIVRLKRTHSIDATVLGVFEQFAEQMQTRGAHVILCGIKPSLMETLQRYGLVDLIGKKNVLETGFGVFASAKQALVRAKELLGESIDTEGLEIEDEMDTWAYEI